MKKTKNVKTGVEIFKSMGGNISGGNFLGGNIPGGNFPGGSLMGRNFPGGNFPDGSFPNIPAINQVSFGDESLRYYGSKI